MKKIILVAILSCFSVSICSAQNSKTTVKAVKPPPTQTTAVAEISDADWKILIDALQAENWEKSSLLASQYLKKFEPDNEKKQLAQLRYFYLYSLAGKILVLSSAKIPADTDAIWDELNNAIENFIGKEFVLPPRQFLPDCRKAVNYICGVKANDRALRITTTNKEGTAIHSFDYILFDEKIPFGDVRDTKIFLGARLKRAEFNQDLSKPWVMRLFFEKGFVNVAANDNK